MVIRVRERAEFFVRSCCVRELASIVRAFQARIPQICSVGMPASRVCIRRSQRVFRSPRAKASPSANTLNFGFSTFLRARICAPAFSSLV